MPPSRQADALVKPANGRPAVSPLSVTVPGRARLRVDGLRNHVALAGQIEDRLARNGAVMTVRANPVTGTLLVVFDPGRLTVGQLVAEVTRSRNGRAPRTNGQPGRGRHRALSSPDQAAWHVSPADAVIRQLDVVPQTGLSSHAAAARLTSIGPNRLPVPESRSGLAMVWDQVATLPVLLLTGAAALSLASGMVFDAAVILGVVAINAAVGSATERRVDRIIAALRDMTEPSALVRRDGKERFVPAATLVPGDVMLLKAGHDVPADGRLIRIAGLSVNESALTGESLPVSKIAAVEHAEETHLAERTNMVYAGTAVSEGSGLAIVTATGSRTEIGRIRKLIAETAAPPTPLERQLDRMGRRLVGASLGFCGLALGLGLARGVPLFEMLRTSIALAVAAVPEGLPAVATTTLALGMHRMLKRHALVRRLAAVESLGATTVICVDKTGTITENRMTVGAWHFEGSELLDPSSSRSTSMDPRLRQALTIGALCNEAELSWDGNGGWTVNGSGTEGALLAAGLRAGIDYRRLRERFRLVSVRPRLEGENWMATVHDADGGRRLMMVKGAPEEVLRLSSSRFDGARRTPLTPEAYRTILEANARMANQGMRVLGLAFKEIRGAPEAYDGLTWTGLVGLTDPIREGVHDAIAACQQAGIRIVMVTGDQSLTALAVARELNLVRGGQLRVLEAPQLLQADAEALRGFAREVAVFARVSPAHKHQIVRTLQADGQVVAMTGDGINDAPALKAADIGVAMGARGTEVARELADVVLLDDNFGSIVGAVEQGRTIYTNVRKALRFLLSTNFSEILMTLGALALGISRPLTAIQFLWINLLSDVFPALALSVEPPDPEVMRQPPRDPAESMLSNRALVEIAGEGAVIAAAGLGAYGAALARSGPGGAASTVAFSTLTAAQLLHALDCRSEHRSALAGLRRSPALVGAIGGTLALQVAAVTVPPLRRLLGTTPLAPADWAIVAGGAVLPLVMSEMRKGFGGGGPGPARSIPSTERRPAWQRSE